MAIGGLAGAIGVRAWCILMVVVLITALLLLLLLLLLLRLGPSVSLLLRPLRWTLAGISSHLRCSRVGHASHGGPGDSRNIVMLMNGGFRIHALGWSDLAQLWVTRGAVQLLRSGMCA